MIAALFHRFRFLFIVCLLAVLTTSAVHLAVDNYRVQGQSMEPTLHDQQYLLVSKFAYTLHEPERGDIIIFRNPRNTREFYIKRVIGIPGDVISVINHHVIINNTTLDESYIRPEEMDGEEVMKWLVTPDNFFVMGDNRGHSSDSRQWGLVPRENILGRVTYRYWPLDSLGFFPDVSNVFATINK